MWQRHRNENGSGAPRTVVLRKKAREHGRSLAPFIFHSDSTLAVPERTHGWWRPASTHSHKHKNVSSFVEWRATVWPTRGLNERENGKMKVSHLNPVSLERFCLETHTPRHNQTHTHTHTHLCFTKGLWVGGDVEETNVGWVCACSLWCLFLFIFFFFFFFQHLMQWQS